MLPINRKMERPTRADLLAKVVELARLPAGTRTKSYFSRQQLTALIVHLEHLSRKLEEMSGTMEIFIRESETSARNHAEKPATESPESQDF